MPAYRANSHGLGTHPRTTTNHTGISGCRSVALGVRWRGRYGEAASEANCWFWLPYKIRIRSVDPTRHGRVRWPHTPCLDGYIKPQTTRTVGRLVPYLAVVMGSMPGDLGI